MKCFKCGNVTTDAGVCTKCLYDQSLVKEPFLFSQPIERFVIETRRFRYEPSIADLHNAISAIYNEIAAPNSNNYADIPNTILELQYEMGCRYYYGEGTKKNYAEAAYWLEKAAKAGHKRAQYMLSLAHAGMKADGINRQNDNSKQYQETRTAAASVVQNASKTTPKRVNPIMPRQADKPKISKAEEQFRTGCRYYNGDGTKKNLSEAAYWLGIAAANGHSGAKEMLKKLK